MKNLEFTTPVLRKHKTIGWTARTTVKDINGYDWEIRTTKNKEKNLIVCKAQGGQLQEHDGYDTFAYVIFKDPTIKLDISIGRCTENNIAHTHSEGLKMFQERYEAGRIPTKPVEA